MTAKWDPNQTEDASLSQYAMGTLRAADFVLTMYMQARAQLLDAQQRFPMARAYHEALEQKVTALGRASQIAATWYGQIRTDALIAFMRLTAPRGGNIAKEAAADNLAAGRDRNEG